MAKLAIPGMAMLFASFGVQAVGVYFISHIGQAELSAAVLSSSVFNTTGANTDLIVI
jgi:Na+-driven multidrug efflux pump